ncbi:MAG: riboflavin synthase [Candidatus Omnitrophica bacterium]|nr:riboflavin synthase [Candidatus Omnitrophota bacterium]
MFSGIIEEVGKVERKIFRSGLLQLLINTENIAREIQPGESLAVNGVCLTVERKEGKTLQVTLSEQTQRETTLGKIGIGEPVNLERALLAGGRLGGHFVTGHVDFQTPLLTFHRQEEAVTMKFRLPENFRRYVVRRGSLAVDGVSLTVAELEGPVVTIWLIPYTITHTSFRFKHPGSMVNVETDILAKHLEAILQLRVKNYD